MLHSLQAKLVVAGILTILLTGAGIFLAGFSFLADYHQGNQTQLLAEQIHIGVLQTRRFEKDFLLRALGDPEFYRTGDSPELVYHRRAIGQLRAAMDSYQRQAPAALLGLANEIEGLFERYESLFLALVATHRERGGLPSQWHMQGHDLLTALEERADQQAVWRIVQDLALLDEWQDEILFQGERALVEPVNTLVQSLNRQLREVLGSESAAFRRFQEFLQRFERFVALQEKIGWDEESGLQGEFRATIHQVDPLVGRILAESAHMAEQARQRLIHASLLTLVGGVLLTSILYWGLASRLTAALGRLAQAAGELGQGNLNARITLGRADIEVQLLAEALNRMAEELHATTVSKAYVDRIIQGMGDALVVGDADGRVLTLNPVAEQFYAQGQAAIASPSMPGLLGERTWQELLTGLRAQTPVILRELLFHPARGEPIAMLFSVAALRDRFGGLEEVVCVGQDIRQRKLAEEKIHQYNQELQELNASKDRFFSIIAHDLRNPLTAIMGYSELLKDELDTMEREELHRMVDTIHDAGRRFHRLLENLLAWSRIKSGRMEVTLLAFELEEKAVEVVELLQDGANLKEIALTLSIHGDTMVWADPDMVATVLRNLLSNAIKFTPHGGRITLECQAGPRQVTLSVTDTGVGMAPEVLEHLFTLRKSCSTLGTDNESGTGLGLVLCREMVAMSSGTIEVSSQVGAGSTFRVTLPTPA